jgi:hypothetical protein
MSDGFEMYVFATWTIWPAFSASVIFERQSLVEMQPAVLTDAVDAFASNATAIPTRTRHAVKKPCLFETRAEWGLVDMDAFPPPIDNVKSGTNLRSLRTCVKSNGTPGT